jgi:predicted O-methyltransferase YrrM
MTFFQRNISLIVLSVSLIGAGCSQTSNVAVEPAPADAQVSVPKQSPALRSPDVVYVPTPPEVAEKMLEMAKVTSTDVLYDLGSGDGRIPIMAAQKFRIRATGIDINPQRIQEANANAQKAGVTDRVRFLNQDLFESDFRDATVVTLYLLPALNEKLRPQLLSQLKPGSRIVSHEFDMGKWKPEKTAQVNVNGRTYSVYLWTVPQNVPANLRSSS